MNEIECIKQSDLLSKGLCVRTNWSICNLDEKVLYFLFRVALEDTVWEITLVWMPFISNLVSYWKLGMKQNTEEMLRGDYTLVEKIAFQTRHTLIS